MLIFTSAAIRRPYISDGDISGQQEQGDGLFRDAENDFDHDVAVQPFSHFGPLIWHA